MSSETPRTDFINVGSVDTLHEEGRATVTVDGRSIVLFSHEGQVHAVDNRCPHMGFPLSKGSLEDGILTCHWHHARFEVSCGSTFDPFADDVDSFPVEVRDGDVWVKPTPKRQDSPAERWRNRLEAGLEENLRLVLAKAVIGLDAAGVNPVESVWTIGDFGTTYRDRGWGSGLSILTALANIHDDLRPDDRPRALYTGASRVATECANEPPRFAQDPFAECVHGADRLEQWFRECVEVRDRQGAERVLRTAIREGLGQDRIVGMLLAGGTDHRYLDVGHTVDAINKACELLDTVGWQHADQVLPSIVPRLVDADRSEERSSWRQPIDLVDRLETSFAALPDTVPTDSTWSAPDGFIETLLSDDFERVLGALDEAIATGATPERLARHVWTAAARRVAQFSTANEFNDWNTVHHTYTYANAVDGLARRTDAAVTYRAILDGATNLYLDRFLNTPPAPLPSPGEVTESPDEIRSALLVCFDREGAVDRAGELVAKYRKTGGDLPDLKETLGEGLLREDANFHTIQNVEAAFRGAALAADDDVATLHLIATARYVAAHTPSRREAEQTFTIASRLHRGEKLHDA